MKKFIGVGIIAVAWLSSSAATDANAAKLFVLNDPQKNQWCGYHDEKRWRSDIDEYGALETASVEFENAYPRTVKLTEADNPESGDWIAYDTYVFDNAGEVLSLKRTTNVLPGDVSRAEVFTVRAGKLIRSKVAYTSLKTGRVIVPRKLWFPDRPLISKEVAIPFYAVLKGMQTSPRPEPFCSKSS